jgi:hypothetical protein
MYSEMYILSTFIFAIHKVFYETKNGQAEAPEGQSARDSYTGEDLARGKQADLRRHTALAGRQIRMDTESVAFRCGE